MAQNIVAGMSTDLADFTVSDVDNNNLSVTLTATNGTIGGLNDAIPSQTGIQLTGTSASINTAIAGTTFAATAAGLASISISVSDGVVSIPTSATYILTAAPSNIAPTITTNGAGSAASISVAENTTAVTTVTATDANLDTPIYSLSGGADASLFGIDADTGLLRFASAPNFEAPADTDRDNVYLVEVAASDGRGGRDTQLLSVTVLDGTDTLVGTSGADLLSGTAAADLIQGLDGNDILIGLEGNDTLHGGAGIDTVQVSANRSVVTLSRAGSNWTLSGPGAIGTDTLQEVERVVLADARLALDLDGNAGLVAKILGAVFGRGEVANAVYAGIGLYYIDGGLTYESLMQLAIDARLGAGASDQKVVELLYTNVVGIPPGDADRAYFVGLLDSGAYTVAGLGVMAADIDLNATNIDLVGLTSTGLEYVPYFDV